MIEDEQPEHELVVEEADDGTIVIYQPGLDESQHTVNEAPAWMHQEAKELREWADAVAAQEDDATE